MEMKQFKLLLLLLLVGLVVACAGAAELPPEESESTFGADTSAEDTGSIDGVQTVEVTRLVTVEVEVLKEVEVEAIEEAMEEADPFGQEQGDYSSGQEITSRATPQPPREKGVTAEPLAAVAEPTAALQPTATWPPAATDPVATSAPAPTAVPLAATNPAVTPVSPRPDPSPTLDVEPEPVERLAAGMVDDNEAFDGYLDYLNRWNGSDVILVDVSVRQRFLILDSAENPIQGAQIDIHHTSEGGTPIATLRTHADGSALLFADAFGLNVQQTYWAFYNDGNTLWTHEFQPIGNQTTHVIVQDTAPETPLKLDIMLLLDATGSMGDEIAQLKDNIQRIAQRTVNLPASPFLRFGMVTYRDIEDEYVTRVEDFSADYQLFEERLRDVKALGGGDYPEDLNHGLHDALMGVNWDNEAIQLIFLVADAPPHLDYGQNNHYIASAFAANERGIKIYPIASSGLDARGEYIFRQLAQLTDSNFIFLVDDEEGDAQSSDDVETEFAVSEFTVGALDDIVSEIIEAELSHQTR